MTGRSWFGRVALLIVGLVSLATQPSAADTPESALSNSDLRDPSLVDSRAQLFAYPQVAATTPRQIFALSRGSSEGSVGTVLDFGGTPDLFLLAQPIGFGSSYGSAGSLDLFHAGIATRLGSVRVGVVGRAGEVSREHTFEDVDGERRSSDILESTREAAAGAGWSSERAYFDVAGSWLRVQESLESSEDRDLAADVDSGDRWSARLRTRFPVATRTSIALSIAFTDRRAVAKLQTSAPFFATRMPVYGHAWHTALALEQELAALGTARLHALVRDERLPRLDGGSFDASITLHRAENRSVGVSLERPGWWKTLLRGGVLFSEDRTIVESVRSTTYSSTSYNLTEDERRDYSFAWGASRSIGDFDLDAQVSSTLRLWEPFATLDAAMRF